MRDGVLLATNVYLPPDTAFGPVPVVLQRTPYGRGYGGAFADSLLAHGIGYVSQDTRGRGDSEGEDSLFLDDGWGERRDGFDTVEWLAAQPWCNGRVGYYGGSAYGITGYLCAGAAPPHLVCAFIIDAAANFYDRIVFPGGCYRKEQVDIWTAAYGLAHMRDLYFEHYVRDEFWDRLDINTRLDSVTIPIYHVGGWFDTFCEGTIEVFCNLQRYGGVGARGHQKMLVGPWTHGRAWEQRRQGDLTFPENSLWDPLPLALKWFLHYLKDEDNGVEDTSAVRVYVLGDVGDTVLGCHWEEFDSWPPAGVRRDSLFIHIDGSLAHLPELVDTFVEYYHDPSAPMYNSGGRNLFPITYLIFFWGTGPRNQFFQDGAEQGVVFTTSPLEKPVRIMGRVKAVLYASSDCIDTDFMVRLEDVYPSGGSYLILDGALKARFREGADHEAFLTPGEVYELEVDLGNVAVVFDRGHRIRIGISSALYNRYDVNPNTGAPVGDSEEMVVAHNRIHLGPSYPTRIVFDELPVRVVDYRLRPGWNLVSYPFDSTAVVDAFPFSSAGAWWFDPSSGSFVEIDTTSPGVGFWVESDVETSFVALGARESVFVRLLPGWNLVGVAASEVPDTVLTRIDGVVAVYGFDPESGGYYVASRLKPGVGYWVLAVDSAGVVVR